MSRRNQIYVTCPMIGLLALALSMPSGCAEKQVINGKTNPYACGCWEKEFHNVRKTILDIKKIDPAIEAHFSPQGNHLEHVTVIINRENFHQDRICVERDIEEIAMHAKLGFHIDYYPTLSKEDDEQWWKRREQRRRSQLEYGDGPPPPGPEEGRVKPIPVPVPKAESEPEPEPESKAERQQGGCCQEFRWPPDIRRSRPAWLKGPRNRDPIDKAT